MTKVKDLKGFPKKKVSEGRCHECAGNNTDGYNQAREEIGNLEIKPSVEKIEKIIQEQISNIPVVSHFLAKAIAEGDIYA